MRDVMTTAERNLVASGQNDAARSFRRQLAQTMRPELVASVESLTGCKVTASMSDSHLASDHAVEIFVLDRAVPASDS
jgi:uncharacterized protein YbcI